MRNASIYTRGGDEYTPWVYEKTEEALYSNVSGDKMIRNPISYIAWLMHNFNLSAWQIPWKKGVDP